LSLENRVPLTIPVPERQTQWDGGSRCRSCCCFISLFLPGLSFFQSCQSLRVFVLFVAEIVLVGEALLSFFFPITSTPQLS